MYVVIMLWSILFEVNNNAYGDFCFVAVNYMKHLKLFDVIYIPLSYVIVVIIYKELLASTVNKITQN